MKCFVCLFFAVLSVTGYAATNLEFKKDCDCKVKFDAEGSGLVGQFLSFTGEGGSVKGKLSIDKDRVTGEMTVNLKDFKTGIGKRDEHMGGELNTKKYPEAKLKLLEASAKDGDHKFKGELTLKGQTKPIEGKYTLVTEGDKKKVRAEFTVDMTKYGLKPAHEEITVGSNVKVTVDAVASP